VLLRDPLVKFENKNIKVKFGSKLLTVNFRQPSHEFSFGVGTYFISYPFELTPLYNKLTLA
jgi:hypothetical protein